jgi:hypothetical protein
MSGSDPQIYRAMAVALRALADHRPDKRDQLHGLAGWCERVASRIESESESDGSPDLGGYAA